MGQKVHPNGLRVGVINPWSSRWFTCDKKFSDNLVEDYKMRKYLKNKLYKAGISKIDIERKDDRMAIFIHTAKPGIIIGRSGTEVDKLKKSIEGLFNKKEIIINIVEVKQIDLDAQIVAENIAAQLEKRISFRRAMKQSMLKTMKAGARGVKTSVSGRLGGVEIARTEHYHEGTIPLQTLRADIHYGFAESDTTYGKIGVKVWIYKGEILPENRNKQFISQEQTRRPDRRENFKDRNNRRPFTSKGTQTSNSYRDRRSDVRPARPNVAPKGVDDNVDA